MRRVRCRFLGATVVFASLCGGLVVIVPASVADHAAWTLAGVVPGSGGADSSQVVVDEQGVVTAAWSTGDIAVSRRAPDGQWGAVETVVSGNYAISDLALSRDGALTLVFTGRRTVFATSRDPVTESWSEPHEVGRLAGSVGLHAGIRGQSRPQLDAAGPRPAVVWGAPNGHVMISLRRQNSSWSAPRRVSPTTGSLSAQPDLAVTQRGLIHVVWRRRVMPGAMGEDRPVVMRTRRPNGTWTPVRRVTSWGGHYPVISVARDGTTAIGMTTGDRPMVAVRRPGRRWRTMPPPRRPGDVSDMDVLAVSRGRAFVVWTLQEWPVDPRDDMIEDLWVAHKGRDGWRNPRRLSWGGWNDAPRLILGTQQEVHVLWGSDLDAFGEEVLIAARAWRDGGWSPASFLTGDGGGRVDVDFRESVGCAVFAIWDAAASDDEASGRLGYSCQIS